MRVLGFAGLALAGSLATASAATVDLDYVGQDPGARTVSYSVKDGEKTRSGGALAGQFKFNVVSGDAAGVSAGDTLLAWCVDLLTNLDQGQHVYGHAGAGDILGDLNALDGLDRLFTQHYRSVVDAVTSAAFQVAIWEIVYDTDNAYDLGAGDFELTSAGSAVRSTAQDFLALGDDRGAYRLTFLKGNPDSQNLVTVAPVPLPASAALMLAGLAALGAARRRRRA